MEKQYIYLEAITSSEWDSVEFALVEYDPEKCNTWNKAMDSVKDSIFDMGSIWSDEADYFIDAEELPFGELPVNGDIIKLSQEQFDKLTRPAQTIKYGEIRFYEDHIVFSSSGKNTGEEFWTEDYTPEYTYSAELKTA